MKKRKTEIYRIQEFLSHLRDMKNDGFLNDLIITAGIHKYYEDKLRKLMVAEGKNPHPFPEERLDYGT